jgi:hypothetical protein
MEQMSVHGGGLEGLKKKEEARLTKGMAILFEIIQKGFTNSLSGPV